MYSECIYHTFLTVGIMHIYVTRGLNSGSATVTANLSADYGAGNGATLVEPAHEC